MLLFSEPPNGFPPSWGPPPNNASQGGEIQYALNDLAQQPEGSGASVVITNKMLSDCNTVLWSANQVLINLTAAYKPPPPEVSSFLTNMNTCIATLQSAINTATTTSPPNLSVLSNLTEALKNLGTTYPSWLTLG
jgi:hypothetical protein